MKKSKVTTLFVLLQAALALPALAASPSTAPKSARIQGTVEFVQRKGIAPITMAPINYWGVIVHASGMDLELPTVIGIEDGRSPRHASIRGTWIRPGDRVTIEGKMSQIREDFGLVSDIDKVALN
ncbi:MAG: hypothetical protein ACJ763_14140 [Bdellovibrionia bacterium]